MNIYLAPMEGITGHVYRRVYQRCFGSIDKYFTPFLAPNRTGSLKKREKREIDPAHNEGLTVVPQILTKNAEDFIRTAEMLAELGYTEVNLNLGCPSGTVVSKGKGSGFLAYPEELDRFLDTVYSGVEIPVSIKTRLGKEDPEDFEHLLDIFNKYPVSELIIHPRVQKDFYGNVPRWEYYRSACEKSNSQVCYNGDIFTKVGWQHFHEAFPETEDIMLGRGILANPGLPGELRGKDPITKSELKHFLDELYYEYVAVLNGDNTILNRLKELWSYQVFLFEDPMFCRRKIRKADSFFTYEAAVETIFREQEIAPGGGFPGGINPQA